VDYNGGGGNQIQDPLDADTGPNGLQNSPRILSATTTGATTSVNVRLTTAANQSYRVEFYSAPDAGSGRTLIGTADLLTNSSGFVETTLPLPALAVGDWVSATSSGPDGTSEFSVPHVVQDPAATGLPLVVTNTDDSGAGSLRQAIHNSNVMINGAAPDEITFNIPGGGVQTIQLASLLPVIGEGVFLNGYSQPGSSANTLATGTNALLMIELSGGGLTVLGSDTTIRGIVAKGIGVGLASNVKIEGNFIGTNASGTAAAANPTTGIVLGAASNSTIGGDTPAARNLISGNHTGVLLVGPLTTGNVIAGNYIGTNKSGTAAIPNGVSGIILGPYAENNLIGGTTAAARNIISGNARGGIAATTNYPGSVYTLGDGNRIQGNYIGTTADGNSALGNGGGSGSRPSGGIVTDEMQILGDGTLTIGGTAAGAGNLISGNNVAGINSTSFAGLPTGTVVVQGNLIGTNAAGISANANQGPGIWHDFLALKLVAGGTTAAERNIVSGNQGNGILGSCFATPTVVQGNYIGTDISGLLPLGNGGHGVLLTSFSAMVGDPSLPGSGNLIAHNTLDGVAVKDFSGSAISRNSIYSNGGLGIDLGDDGVTANDAGDSDTGPNDFQNFPVLTSAITNGATTTIQGTLNSLASQQYTIQFFTNTACDGSGNGEGEIWLGELVVMTDGSGNATINATVPVVPPGQLITATATGADTLDTSEFSACQLVTSGPCTLSCPSNITTSNTPGQCGTVVNYPAPTTTGECGTVSCVPASGTSFPVGTTTVTCTATAGPSCSFTVTINDTQAPSITCPANVNVTAGVQGDCAVVNYETPTVNDNCPGATVDCAPASGSCFPVGTTTVTCTATDVSKNSGNCSFTVEVMPASSLSPICESFSPAEGSGSVAVTAAGKWTAISNDPSWVTVTTGASGKGDGTVTYSVAANPSPNRRVATLTINGDTFTVRQGGTFTDVPPSHMFYTEIGKIHAQGITLGCGSSNYCPDRPVTRQEMAAFIIRALGDFNPPQPGQQRFDDVPPSNIFYAFIDQLAVREITLGCSASPPLYCPFDTVKREQMAAFFIRALHAPGYVPPEPAEQRFEDVPPTNPFYAQIEEMAMRGITVGCSASPPLYCPSDTVTRGQMAAFLIRAFPCR
jgi:hypothetical protein